MASSSNVSTVDTQHQDMIHDVQLGYYGKRLVTCSSDKTIKIFEVGEPGNPQAPAKLLQVLTGHEGPVWQVAWAHPKFGSMLASCSYDKKAIIWKESSPNKWDQVYTLKHDLSVNSVAWAPEEFGLCLACGSSDGTVSILTLTGDGNWEHKKIEAHTVGVNCVSWAPAQTPSSLIDANAATAPMVKRFASGGCDNDIKIWKFSESDNSWSSEQLKGHQDWVRDVAWAPNVGLPCSTLASCSQDGAVFIWTQDGSGWTSNRINDNCNEVVWRVSWSLTGNMLAVSSGDNKVTLWKENLDHTWASISTLDDANTSG